MEFCRFWSTQYTHGIVMYDLRILRIFTIPRIEALMFRQDYIIMPCTAFRLLHRLIDSHEYSAET